MKQAAGDGGALRRRAQPSHARSEIDDSIRLCSSPLAASLALSAYPVRQIAWLQLPATVGFSVLIVLISAGNRVATDWPNIAAGTIPTGGSPPKRDVPGRRTIPALPPVPLDGPRRVTGRHYRGHRGNRLGVSIPAQRPTGDARHGRVRLLRRGLVTALLAIKRGEVMRHRQWTIRARRRARGRHDQNVGPAVPSMWADVVGKQLRDGVLARVRRARTGDRGLPGGTAGTAPHRCTGTHVTDLVATSVGGKILRLAAVGSSRLPGWLLLESSTLRREHRSVGSCCGERE